MQLYLILPPPSPLLPPQPTYYYCLQKALSVMAHDNTEEGAVPLYYFDLRLRNAVSIPHLPPPLPSSLHPPPFTLHPPPFTLLPSPSSLHPSPSSLHPPPFTLHPPPFTLLPSPFSPFTLLSSHSVHLHSSSNPLPILLILLLPHVGLSGLPPDHWQVYLQLSSQEQT